MNVVVAVIVEKTLENSLHTEKEKLKDRRLEMDQNWKKTSEKIHDIFCIADADKDSTLTRNEFLDALFRPDVMRFLHEVGIDVHRADGLFDILDYDESGVLDAQEFVEGVMNARGDAQSKDVLELHCDLWRWEQIIMKRQLASLRAETD